MQDYYSLSELSMISFANLILIEQVMKQLHMKETLAFWDAMYYMCVGS